MCKRSFIVVFILLLLPLLSLAQEVKVRGRFLADSIKIGGQIPYALTATYPSSLNLVFPDSTFSFAPFEIQKKQYFPTRTTENISYDSAIYFLTTFEIDSLQALSLPTFTIHRNDCTAVYAISDTIFLKQLVRSVPDSISAQQLPLKINTSYQSVKWLLNYWVVIILLSVLLILILVGWIVFGKRMKKYFILRRLQRKHNAFLEEFSKRADQLRTNVSVNHAEDVLVVWKKYMEKLLTKPFTSFTSKEILAQEKDELLAIALQKVDRMIYQGTDSYSEEAITSLSQYAQQRFTIIVEGIKHG